MANSFVFRMWVCRLTLALLFSLAVGTAYGQFTYRDLHDFGGTTTNSNGTTGPDGNSPISNVTFDSAGNAYGTTYNGGANNNKGMVWELTSAGVYKDLHDFGGTTLNTNGSLGPDGALPTGLISFDSQGNLYGTTPYGGAYIGQGSGAGMLWEITAGGIYKDLHDFGGTVINANGSNGADGQFPNGVTVDQLGNLYGTAEDGGGRVGYGMVWEFESGETYLDLHDFGGTVINANGISGPDGAIPMAGVTVDGQGNIYGTTNFGGPNQASNYGGILWEITAGGAYMDLHDFGGTITLSSGVSGPDGDGPQSVLLFDSQGNMYSTTSAGGPYIGQGAGAGITWEITAGGAYKDLHDFGGTIINANGASGPDGQYPVGVTLDSAGDLIGAAGEGGPIISDTPGYGMIWEITAVGAYKDLHDFGGTIINADGASGPDGQNPNGVTLDSSGNLIGTAVGGGGYGTSGFGMIWELERIPRVSTISLNPSTIGGLGTTTATITLTSAALSGGTAVSVHAGASGYLNMPATVTVPAGATTATFTITGLAQRPSTLNMGIFASANSSTAEAILIIQGDSLMSFILSPSEIKWTSGTSTATLTLASAAPPGGWNVTLTPGVSGYVNMPTAVSIPAGSTSATFSISGNALRFFTLDLGITASDGGSRATTTLVIAGDAVKGISVSPSTIYWGETSTATINLVVAAPPGGWLVNTNPGASGYVTMPSSINVPAGATSATFTITAGSPRSLTLNLGIYANDGPSNQFTILTIEASLSTLIYRDIHDFGGTVTNANGTSGPDGFSAYAGVSYDSLGDMFGTANGGGPNNASGGGDGMVWEITASGVYKDLHDFGGTVINANGSSGPDGANTYAVVLIDSSNNLYGATFQGGQNGEGMIWEITSSGVYKDLHDFGGTVINANGSSGPDGAQPQYSGLSFDPLGNMYGSAHLGGANGDGMIWEISPAGIYKDLHDFGGTITIANGTSGADGTSPSGLVASDSSGNLFGAALFGGPSGNGMVWEIESGGTYVDLHDFGGTVTNANRLSGPDGLLPFGVTLDSAGDKFGTAAYGGASGLGMVWEITSTGTYKDLHDFGVTVNKANGTNGPDGQYPFSGVVLDPAGDKFGTADLGGSSGVAGSGSGMVWEITAAGAYNDLHDFGGTVTNANGTSGSDGSDSLNYGGVRVDSVGNIYGTTDEGGANSGGIAWELVHDPIVVALSLNPNTIGGLGTTTGTITLKNPAPMGGWPVSVHAGTSGYLNMPATVTVAAGTTSTMFAITGTAQRSSTLNLGIIASDTVSSSEAILTIQGDSVQSISLNPSTITALGTSTATVTLASAAPPGGWVLTMHAGASGFVSMPTTLTVPAGATTATFTITGIAQHSSTINLGIFASDGNTTQEAILTIT